MEINFDSQLENAQLYDLSEVKELAYSDLFTEDESTPAWFEKTTLLERLSYKTHMHHSERLYSRLSRYLHCRPNLSTLRIDLQIDRPRRTDKFFYCFDKS